MTILFYCCICMKYKHTVWHEWGGGIFGAPLSVRVQWQGIKLNALLTTQFYFLNYLDFSTCRWMQHRDFLQEEPKSAYLNWKPVITVWMTVCTVHWQDFHSTSQCGHLKGCSHFANVIRKKCSVNYSLCKAGTSQQTPAVQNPVPVHT